MDCILTKANPLGQSRNRLVNIIHRYMDEALTAFAFDEEITEIRTVTADGTVHFVIDSLWYHYDDCKDHLAGLSKHSMTSMPDMPKVRVRKFRLWRC